MIEALKMSVKFINFINHFLIRSLIGWLGFLDQFLSTGKIIVDKQGLSKLL